MKRFLLRFLPFLFVRNWYTGAHELSRTRTIAFICALGIVTTLLIVWRILAAPVVFGT